MYKTISLFLKAIIFLLLLLHLIFYIVYCYQLKDIDLSVYTTKQKIYKLDYHVVLWTNLKISSSYTKDDKNRAKNIRMNPIYPTYDIATYFLNKKHSSPPSQKISYLVVNNLSKLRNERIKKYAIQIWLSHHLTFEEISSLYFNICYYGQGYYGLKEATTGYFNKKSNELTYEIVMLVALTTAPSYLNPKRHPKKLLEKMNHLISKLKRNFPQYYENLIYQKKLPYLLRLE
jgi:hypothetical protein